MEAVTDPTERCGFPGCINPDPNRPSGSLHHCFYDWDHPNWSMNSEHHPFQPSLSSTDGKGAERVQTSKDGSRDGLRTLTDPAPKSVEDVPLLAFVPAMRGEK